MMSCRMYIINGMNYIAKLGTGNDLTVSRGCKLVSGAASEPSVLVMVLYLHDTCSGSTASCLARLSLGVSPTSL